VLAPPYRYIPSFNDRWYAQSMTQPRNIFSIVFGIGASKPVVEMSGMQIDSQSVASLGQYVKQANGIRTPRNPYHQGTPGGK
jgi:hypothetical protein